MLLYHGKQVFAKSGNNISLHAQTVVGILLMYLKGSPKFLEE